MSKLSWKPKPPMLRHRARTTPAPAKPTPAALEIDAVSHDTRLFVWHRDGGRCRNCGANKDLHFDHIIPRSWGGSSRAENIQLLCSSCNLKKGANLVPPFPRVRDEMP
jgi:hypothetical protein